MSVATEYRVRVVEGEGVEIDLPSGKTAFPLDLIMKSSTLRNILADSDCRDEIALSFPTGICHLVALSSRAGSRPVPRHVEGYKPL